MSSSIGLAVGSVAPSPDAAQAIGPAVMVVFIVFGGDLQYPYFPTSKDSSNHASIALLVRNLFAGLPSSIDLTCNLLLRYFRARGL